MIDNCYSLSLAILNPSKRYNFMPKTEDFKSVIIPFNRYNDKGMKGRLGPMFRRIASGSCYPQSRAEHEVTTLYNGRAIFTVLTSAVFTQSHAPSYN